MSRISGLLRIFGLLVVILIFVAVAIANRAPVLINFDPFGSDMAALGIQVPLFIALFSVFILGFAAGAIALWLGTSAQRRQARAHRKTERVAIKAAEKRSAASPPKSEPQLQAKNEAQAASRMTLTG